MTSQDAMEGSKSRDGKDKGGLIVWARVDQDVRIEVRNAGHIRADGVGEEETTTRMRCGMAGHTRRPRGSEGTTSSCGSFDVACRRWRRGSASSRIEVRRDLTLQYQAMRTVCAAI